MRREPAELRRHRRRVQQDEPRERPRTGRLGEDERSAAGRVSDAAGSLELELVDDGEDVVAEELPRVAALGLVRLAVAALIERR